MPDNFLKSIIRSIDFFGIKPKIMIDKSYKHKTLLGGIITIFISILILLGFIHFGRELIDKINPTVISSGFYQSNPDEYILKPDNFNFFIGIQNKNSEYYVDPSLVKLDAKYISFTRKIIDGKIDWTPVERSLNMEPCVLERHFQDFKQEFTGLPLSDLYCLNPNDYKNISLAGSWGEDLFNLLAFHVSPCKNSTESNIICKSSEEIQKTLAGGFFVVNHIDTIFEPKNFKNPRKYFRRNYYTTMSNSYFKELNFYFKNIEYNTDQGFLMEDIKSEKYMQSDNIKELYDFRSVVSGDILQCNFRLSNQKDVYNRKYSKIQDVIAQVGGLVKAILIITNLLYFNFSNVSYYFYLKETIFELDNPEHEENNNFASSKVIIIKNNLDKSIASISNSMNQLNKPQKLSSVLSEKKLQTKDHGCWKKFKIGLCICFVNNKTKGYKKEFLKFKNYIEEKTDFKNLLLNQERFETIKNILLSYEQKTIFDYYTHEISLNKYSPKDGQVDISEVLRSYEILNSTRQNKIGQRLRTLFENKLL